MSKKGFTFIELLAIIIILAIILTITVPRVFSALNASFNQTYKIYLQNLEMGARSYVLSKNITIEENSQAIVTSAQMIETLIIDELIDPQTKEACEGYVIVSNNGIKYIFDSYLSCEGGYVSENYGVTE